MPFSARCLHPPRSAWAQLWAISVLAVYVPPLRPVICPVHSRPGFTFWLLKPHAGLHPGPPLRAQSSAVCSLHLRREPTILLRLRRDSTLNPPASASRRAPGHPVRLSIFCASFLGGQSSGKWHPGDGRCARVLLSGTQLTRVTWKPCPASPRIWGWSLSAMARVPSSRSGGPNSRMCGIQIPACVG